MFFIVSLTNQKTQKKTEQERKKRAKKKGGISPDEGEINERKQLITTEKRSQRQILLFFIIISLLLFFFFLSTASKRSRDISSESLTGSHSRRTRSLTKLIHNILSLSEIDGFQAGPQLHFHVLDHATDVGDMGVLVVDGTVLLGLGGGGGGNNISKMKYE